VGRLTPGISRGDVTVLSRRHDPTDAGGEATTLACVLTIRDGVVVHDTRSDSEP